ncbi:MAG: anti-sigma factor antagonist [Calditrichaeota bacterium]|nr:MAG: anti-sigma factor antagonist [Calditrichota bacterium]
MKFEEIKDEDIWILKFLEDRFDSMSVSDFKEKITAEVENGNNKILLNLNYVDFVDSSGLAALVYCFKIIGAGGKFGICQPKDTVMSMLKLTRMDRVFKIYESEEQAISDFKK